MKRTKKDLENIVQHLNKRRELPLTAYSMNAAGETVANVGHLHVDTWTPGDQHGTRYRLARISKGGGVSYVGTNRAFNLREFDAFVSGILAAAELERMGP